MGTFEKREKNGVTWLSATPFEKMEGIVQGFSTRLGGVSTEHLSSMNLSFSRGDQEFQKNCRCDRFHTGRSGLFRSDAYDQHPCGDRSRPRQRIYKTAGLYGCGRTDHRRSGTGAGNVLCRLCAAVFCRSHQKSSRAFTFRLAWNGS